MSQKKYGATSRVLNHIRNSGYYAVTPELNLGQLKPRRKNPTGRRKIINAVALVDGTWVTPRT